MIRSQGESSKAFGGNDAADAEPQRVQRRPLAAQRAFRRDRFRLGERKQHGVALLDRQQPGQRLVEHDLVVLRRQPTRCVGARPAAEEVPESLVATDDIDLIDAFGRIAVGRLQPCRFKNYRRGRDLAGRVAGQFFAEEVVGDEGFVDVAQSGQRGSRRLTRIESPTKAPPVSTAVPTAAPQATATFIFQKWRRESSTRRSGDISDSWKECLELRS